MKVNVIIPYYPTPIDMGQDICLGESYADYMWPDTTVGTTVNLPCSSGEDVSSASVSRQCNTGGSWGELFGPECVSNAVAVLQDQVNNSIHASLEVCRVIFTVL